MTKTGKRKNEATAPFHKENPFWGAVGGFLAFCLAGMGFAVTGHATLGRWLIGLAWPWALLALCLAINGLAKGRKRRIVGKLAAVLLVALLAWCADKLAQPPKAALHFSLVKLADRDSLAFVEKPLKPGEAFYRFQILNRNTDTSNVLLNLDLPALLTEQPIVISSNGAESMTVKAESSPFMVTVNGNTQRVSTLDNSAVIEIPQFHKLGFVDIGFITAATKPKTLTIVTAPANGALQIAVAPAYNRYGSMSIRYRLESEEDKNIFHSFPVRYPRIGVELIDSTKELRPESRSILLPLTQDDFRDKNTNLTLNLSYFMSEIK